MRQVWGDDNLDLWREVMVTYPYALKYDRSRNPGLQKLVLAFALPRGSYATLIVKRLQAGAKTAR